MGDQMADNLLSRVEVLLDANTARFESGFERAEKIANQSTKNMTAGFQSVTSGAKKSESQVDSFGHALSKHDVEVTRVSKSYNVLYSSVAAAVGSFSVAKVISIADGYGQMSAQIQLATKDQQEYNKVQKHLLETANTTYRALSEAQQVYLDVGSALKTFGATTERALRITDSLSFSFTHNATAADRAKSATEAFKKSIYDDRVSGDSWRAMLSAIPSIVDDMSESLGKSKDVILTMGNAGEFTADQLKDSFDKSREKSERLANEMRNSLADGIQTVSNAFTVMVGEANITYDVTNKLASGLGILAENLNTVTNVGIVGAAFYAGTYIPAVVASTTAGYAKAKQVVEQTAVQYAAIQAERTAAGTDLARAKSQIINTQSTISALQAERALEIQRMKSQISAQGLAASHTRLAQVAVIEAQAKAELIIANNTLAASQARVTAAQNAGMGISRSLTGALFGPVGLGIAVASVAAGYLMMRDTTTSATVAFDIQKGEVDDLVAKYRELDDLQRRTTMREVEKELKSLTSAYTSSYAELSAYVEWLESSGSVSEATARQMSNLLAQYSQGKIDAATFSTSVNDLAGIQEKHKVKIDNLTVAQRDSKIEYERLKSVQAALTSQTQDAINANHNEAKSIDAKREAQQKLNAEQQSAYDKIKTQLERENYVKVNMKARNISRERAEFDADLRGSAGMGFTNEAGRMPEDLRQMGDAAYKLKQEAEARKKAEQETAKSLKDQEKSTKRLVGLVGSTGRSTGNHLHVQYPKGSGKGGVTAEHMSRLQLGGQTLKPSMTNSHYGKIRSDGKKHGGWDFRAPAGTEVTTNVAVKDVQKMVSENGGYTSRVTFADGVVIDLMHQIPSMMSKVKGGSSSGATGVGSSSDAYKAFQDQLKADEDERKKRAQLTLDVEDEVTKTRTKLAEKFTEIDSAGYSDADAIALKAKYQARADNEIAIAQQALKTKIDSYSEYLKSEEDLLKDSYAERQFDVLHDLELTKTEREQAVAHLQQQMQYEVDAIKQKEDQQVQSAFEAYLNETQIVLKRYKVERDEIQKNYRLSEETRTKLLQANSMKTDTTLTKNDQAVNDVYFNSLDYVFRKNEPNKAASYDLNNQRTAAWGDLESKYSEQRGGIFQAVDDENQRSEQLLAAHEQFLQAKSALEDEYSQRSKDLALSQHVEQLQLWSSLTSQAQNTWSQMTQAVKEGSGEQSAAYKAAFLAQQVFAIASTLISAHVAATQAAADPTNITMIGKISASQAMLAMGYANAALIGAQTIAGFSGGGYTGQGGKYDFAGAVHKGEIVWSQADIERWGGVSAVESMRTSSSSGYADGGIVGNDFNASSFEINQNNDLAKVLADSKSSNETNINFYTLPGQTADVSTNEDGSMDIRMRKIAEDTFVSGVSNPNSRISKSMQQNTNAGRRR